MACRPGPGGFVAVVFCACVCGIEPAAAQQPAPQTPAPTVPPRTPGAAAPTAPATAPSQLGTIQLPEVSDPMLEPVPPARNRLRTWREALRMLRARATTVRISRAQVAQARGVARQALSGALPQLDGTASVNRHLLLGTGTRFSNSEGIRPNTTIPDPATIITGSLNLRQPLLALETWNNIKISNMRVDAAEFDAKDAERRQLATVASTAVDVVTAERVAEVSQVSLRSALSTLELTRRRAQLGASSAVDVLRAQQEVSSSRAQVVSADEQVRRAREALGLALGNDQPWGISPDVSLEELASAARTSCQPVPDLQSRADLRSANAQVQISKQSEKSIDYRYAPTLDLNSTLGYTSDVTRSANGKHVTWTIGATLNWPLFDGGNREGDRMRAEAETTISRETMTDAKRNALLEVTQAARAIQVARANLTVSKESRDIAKESARLSTIAFVNGTGTSFDLVDTAQKLRQAEIDLAIKEFELVRAQIAAFIAQANCSL